jgi:hypothetical protein
MKKRIQGMLAGFLAAIIVIGGTTLANTGAIPGARYDIKVVVNGVPQNFSADMAPFILDGRTFLPVRGIAEALGVTVDWDHGTRTVSVIAKDSTPTAATPQGETVKLSSLDWFSKEGDDFTHSEQMRANTGDYFSDCFSRNMSGNRSRAGGGSRDYLVNGQYKKISGTVFLDYASRENRGAITGKFNIWGDGRLLYSSDEIKGGFMPTYFEVDISNVNRLKIGFEKNPSLFSDSLIIAISDVTLHK